MGAFSELYALDIERLHNTVAPALFAMLRGESIPAWLEASWAKDLHRALDNERRNPRHYAKYPRRSEAFQTLRSGTLVDLATACIAMDHTLSISPADPSNLRGHIPDIKGGCTREDCDVYARCPFHQRSPHDAEPTMELFQRAVLTCCNTDTGVPLGRHATLFNFRYWYGWEHDIHEPSAPWLDSLGDPVLILLTRLGRRAAIWGWGDGGFGEGVLGWLDAEECQALVDALAAFDLSSDAPIPERVAHANESDDLRRLRQLMGKIRTKATRCAKERCGLLLFRT